MDLIYKLLIYIIFNKFPMIAFILNPKLAILCMNRVGLNNTGQQNKSFFPHRGYKPTFLNQFSMLIPNLVLKFSRHVKFFLDMEVLILPLFYYLALNKISHSFVLG